MRFIALLLVTIFSFTNSALAEDENPFGISLYGSFLHTERVPNALFFFDKIKDGDSFELRKALRDHDIEIIVLSSPGGSVYEGLTMAGILHDKKLTTYIPKKNLFTDGQGDCASACAYMYLAGSTRVADGKLGVHQFASSDADASASIAEIQESAQTVVSDIAGLLGDFEVPTFVYPKMFQSREMYYFKESELAEIERINKEIGYKTIKEIDRFTDELIAMFTKDFENDKIEKNAKENTPNKKQANEEVSKTNFQGPQKTVNEPIKDDQLHLVENVDDKILGKIMGLWYFDPTKSEYDNISNIGNAQATCTPMPISFNVESSYSKALESNTWGVNHRWLNRFKFYRKNNVDAETTIDAYFVCREGGFFALDYQNTSQPNYEFYTDSSGQLKYFIIRGVFKKDNSHVHSTTLAFSKLLPTKLRKLEPTSIEKERSGIWTVDLSGINSDIRSDCNLKLQTTMQLKLEDGLLNSFYNENVFPDYLFSARADLTSLWYYLHCKNTGNYFLDGSNVTPEMSNDKIIFDLKITDLITSKKETAKIVMYKPDPAGTQSKKEASSSLKSFEGTWYIATDIGHPERCSSPNPIKLSYQDGSLTNNFGAIVITEKSANGKIYCSRGYAVLRGEPRGSKSLTIYADYCLGSKCVPQVLLLQKSKPAMYVKPKTTVQPKIVVGKDVTKSNKSAPSKAPSDAEIRGLIKIAQENLNRLGCDAGIADGIFGANTRSALARFNNANSKNYQEKDLEKYETINSIKSSNIKCKPLVITHPKGTFYGYKLWDASMCKGLFSYCPNSGDYGEVALMNPNSDEKNPSNMPSKIGGKTKTHCQWNNDQQVCYYR